MYKTENLNRFEIEILQKKSQDVKISFVNFILLLLQKGLEMGFRKYFKKRYTLLPNTYDPELFYRPILSENIVTKLVQLEQLYCKKKSELPGNVLVFIYAQC